jgi:hypothetical protein
MPTKTKQTLIIPAQPLIDDIVQAINRGMATTERARPSGCGRVYVCISYVHPDWTVDKATQRLYKRQMLVHQMPRIQLACERTGRIYQQIGYQVKHCIYIGYDNCTGKELAKGEAVATQLKALGIKAYMEAVGD